MMIAKVFHLSSLVDNMKIYYIDDSMLSKSEFATQILSRFEFHLKKEPADLILISAGDKESPLLKHFIETQLHTPILVSPAQFDFQGVRGDLHNSVCKIEGFSDMQSYSGSFVAYDTEQDICERIYLELFLDHDNGEIDDFVKEIEEMLSDKIQSRLKNKGNWN